MEGFGSEGWVDLYVFVSFFHLSLDLSSSGCRGSVGLFLIFENLHVSRWRIEVDVGMAVVVVTEMEFPKGPYY